RALRRVRCRIVMDIKVACRCGSLFRVGAERAGESPEWERAAQRLPVECLRRQLAEQPLIRRGELPGVPEAPALSDLPHGRRVRGGGLQLLTDRIEPTRLEIGHRAQAADLLERVVQRPLAYGHVSTH